MLYSDQDGISGGVDWRSLQKQTTLVEDPGLMMTVIEGTQTNGAIREEQGSRVLGEVVN